MLVRSSGLVSCPVPSSSEVHELMVCVLSPDWLLGLSPGRTLAGSSKAGDQVQRVERPGS